MAICKDKPATTDEACKVMTKVVGRMASKWARNHRDRYEDLFQAGMVGVLIAYEKFDGKHGASFSTYAYMWIFDQIKQCAVGSWKVDNNTYYKPIDDMDISVGTVDEMLSTISIEKSVSKLPEHQQRLYELRKEGYTFAEMAEKEGYKSLHAARNELMEVLGAIAD